MSVKVRERPKGSGEYWLFIDQNGKRKAKKIGDKKTANAIARKTQHKLASGELGLLEEKNDVPFFKDYVKYWLDQVVKGTCKYSTWEHYEGYMRNHILPTLGHIPIDQIKRKDVKELLLKKKNSKLSVKTVKNLKVTISSVLNSAYEDELIGSNPALRMGKFLKSNDPKQEVDTLTKEEVLLLLETINEIALHDYPVFLLAISTGMRLGEILGLQPGDLDFNGHFLTVKRALVRKMIVSPKNGKQRRVDMSILLEDVLKKHVVKTKELTLKNGWKKIPETLFYNREGNALDSANIAKRCFHRYLEKSGLRRVKFHSLRHSFASIHIANGESLAYIRDQLGHHSIQVTVDMYGHLVPGSNREAADRLLSISQPIRNLSATRGVLGVKKAPKRIS